MASVAFAALAAPLSPDDPCGPDLDLDGDLDYMNYMARLEGALPASYFARDDDGKQTLYDRARDYQPIDFAAELAQAARFLSASRDIRLFALAARLTALNRDMAGFCDCVAGCGRLVAEQWEGVHPRAEGGDFTARSIALQTFDDMPTVILPLQHMVLFASRRYGPVTYRNKMVAAGEVPPAGEGDTPMSATTIASALDDADLASLVASRDRIAGLRDALAGIAAATREHMGRDQGVGFDRLLPLAKGMFAFLDEAIGRRDPAAKAGPRPGEAAAAAGASATAAGAEAASPARPVGPVTSVSEAAAALAAAGAYFMRCEPSNPAIPVIRQAEQLIGKSFSDVIRILFPADAERATIRIGGKQAFDLSFQRIAALDEDCAANAPARAGDEEAADGREGDGQDSAGEHRAGQGAAEEGAAADDSVEEGPGEAGSGEEGSGRPAAARPASGNGAGNGGGRQGAGKGAGQGAKPLLAADRGEAIALLRAVGGYFRMVEPSSPIPLLTDRVCDFSQKDFLALISDVLPGVGIHQTEEESS